MRSRAIQCKQAAYKSIFTKLGNGRHVDVRGRKTLQMHGFLYKHIGKLQTAITLIVRCASKICLIKSLVSAHSACSCKNYPPKCSQIPHELDHLITV